MIEEKPPLVLPREAIAYFRRKGFQIGFDWRDVWQEEHARAFTVAKAMTLDLLADIRAAVDTAIAEGQSLGQFAKDLKPKLFEKGWWGRQWMTDPETGEEKVVQLGSPRRLKTIYQTNMRTAHAAGAWERIQRNKKLFPYLRYTSVMDGRERPQHNAWHDTILPVDDPWWDTHYPPCDWGCRCTTLAMDQRLIDRRGLKVSAPPVPFPDRQYINKRTGEITRIEAGIGPGWAYNVGKAALDGQVARIMPGASEEDAAQASRLFKPEAEPLMAFFKGFELPGFSADPIAAMIKGRVWRDAAGWPWAISAGLFRGVDGELRLPDVDMSRIADVLLTPDEIRLVWVRDAKGAAVLMRRYVKAGVGLVDMGRIGWRFRLGRVKPQAGLLVWSAAEGEVAAYNPRQPRDARGQWARSGGFPVATDRSRPLTPEENYAVEQYTGPAYENINQSLRDQIPADEIDDETQILIDDLDSAISKGSIRQDVRLYRGYSGDGVGHLEAASLSVGSIYSDDGFLSTSKDWLAADRFAGNRNNPGVLFIIHAKAGMPALDVSRKSSVGTGEHEVIFPRNAKFKVKSIDLQRAVFEVETVK